MASNFDTNLTEIPDYSSVMDALKKNKNLDKYYQAFKNILLLLQEAVELQEKYRNRLREMQCEMEMQNEEIIQIRKKQSDDSVVYEKMQDDLRVACKNLEHSENKNLVTSKEVQHLKDEIQILQESKQEKRSERHITEELDIHASREISSLNKTISQLESDLKTKEMKLSKVESDLADVMGVLKQYESDLHQLKTSLEKEFDRSVKADRARIKAQKSMSEREARVKDLENKLADIKKTLTDMERKLSSQKQRAQSLQQRNKELHQLYKNSQLELGTELQKLNSVDEEKTALLIKLTKKDDEMAALREKLLQAEKVRTLSAHTALCLRHRSKNADVQIETLKIELANVEKDKNNVTAKKSQDEKLIGNLVREKDLLGQNLSKMENLVAKYAEECKRNGKANLALTQDLRNSQRELTLAKRSALNLENAQQKCLIEIDELKQKVETLQNDLNKVRSMEESYKKNIEELASHWKEQQDLSESLANNVPGYYQCYKAAKDCVQQQLGKLIVLNKDLKEMHKAVEERDLEILKLISKIGELAMSRQNLLDNLKNQESKNATLKLKMKSLEEETKEHACFISHMEEKCKNLQTKLNVSAKDNEVLSTQMITKNEKILEVNMKLKEMNSSLQKLEQRCADQEEDIRTAKQEINSLLMEKQLLTGKLTVLSTTKYALSQAQEELVQEKGKSKALACEMEHPWNIHRWRVLQGTDPDRYHLIMKQNFLQKQLIHKTIENEQKEIELTKKDEIIKELKSLAAKRASAEGCEQCVENRWQIREKNEKVKILSAQVNMYESLMSSYQRELEELKAKCKTLKGKYFKSHTKQKFSQESVYLLSD